MKVQKAANQVERNLNKAYMKSYYRPDGTRCEFLTAKRGNSTYARRSNKQLLAYEQDLLQGTIAFSILFLTVVVPCNKTYKGCYESWEAVSKAVGPFIKALKRMGLQKFIAILEATAGGNSHIHVLARWDRTLKTCKRRGKYHLAEQDLRKAIQERWATEWVKVSERKLNNHPVCIRVCPNLPEARKVFGYVTKHLGWGSLVCDALRRVRNGEANHFDSEKLFSNYWASKLRVRLCRTSRGLGKTGAFI